LFFLRARGWSKGFELARVVLWLAGWALMAMTEGNDIGPEVATAPTGPPVPPLAR